MVPVYVSNGAFITRYNGRDYHLLDTIGSRLEADGIEFLMYESWNDDIKNIRRFAKGLSVAFPTLHIDKDFGESLSEGGLEARDRALSILRRDAETALEIGSKKLIAHLWNGPCSDSRFDEVRGVAADAMEYCGKLGLEFTVENVACRRNLALTHLEELSRSCPGITFTYDTKMAFLHGENELLGSDRWSWLLSEGHITHLHVNDSRMQDMGGRLPILHMGEGDVDFAAFFALLKKHGYSGTATVESTTVNQDGFVDIDKLNRTLAAVRRGLNG